MKFFLVTFLLFFAPTVHAADFGLFGTPTSTPPPQCLPLFSYCAATAQCELIVGGCQTPTPTEPPSSGSSGGGSGGGGGGGDGGSGGGGGGGGGGPAAGAVARGADLNGSGRVDIFDLSILLRNWGRSGQGDLNGDGKVDIFDLSILLRSWSR